MPCSLEPLIKVEGGSRLGGLLRAKSSHARFACPGIQSTLYASLEKGVELAENAQIRQSQSAGSVKAAMGTVTCPKGT